MGRKGPDHIRTELPVKLTMLLCKNLLNNNTEHSRLDIENFVNVQKQKHYTKYGQ